MIDEQYPGLRTSNRRGNHTAGEMNKTEQRFYRDRVEPLLLTGEIIASHFEAINFKLAGDKCWYRPDFVLFYADGRIEAIDVKGGAGFEDDALVKIKVAAAQYPMFFWSAWTWKKSTGWVQRKFGE